MTAYTIFRVIIALVTGAVFYIVDRRGGTELYRWWYGMTHEHPLPGDVHRGFVYNRNTKNRVIAATILSSLIAIPAVMYGQYSALLELGLWLLSIPIIVGAFMVGPRIAAAWGKRDEVYDAVDKWELGEAGSDERAKIEGRSVSADATRAATTPAPVTPAAEAAAPVPDADKHESPSDDTPKVPHPEPETDPQELVNRFINRGQS